MVWIGLDEELVKKRKIGAKKEIKQVSRDPTDTWLTHAVLGQCRSLRRLRRQLGEQLLIGKYSYVQSIRKLVCMSRSDSSDLIYEPFGCFYALADSNARCATVNTTN